MTKRTLTKTHISIFWAIMTATSLHGSSEAGRLRGGAPAKPKDWRNKASEEVSEMG
jgi:hypothetical protein